MKTTNILNLTLFVLVAGLVLSGCNAKQAKQLLQHKNALSAIAGNKNASPDQKLDVLMTNMVTMMHEGMRIANPKKGVSYVSKFGKENTTSINQIIGEVAAWQKNMNTAQQLAFGAQLLRKPYAKDALELIPKFVRKYKQIAFVTKTVGNLKSNILGGNMGGNMLEKGLKGLGL